MPQRSYTLQEEIGNTVTHVIGALICAFLFGAYAYRTFIETHRLILDIGCCLFGLSSVFVFIASSLYHAVTNSPVKKILKKYDHIAIYYLIAGTYIPLIMQLVVPNHPVIGWSFIALLSLSVVCGTFYKMFCRNCYGLMSVFIYCVMGWSILPIIVPLVSHMPNEAMFWFIAGGFMYMAGVPFYVLKQYKWTHTVWHILVVFGIISHYMTMFSLRLPVSV